MPALDCKALRDKIEKTHGSSLILEKKQQIQQQRHASSPIEASHRLISIYKRKSYVIMHRGSVANRERRSRGKWIGEALVCTAIPKPVAAIKQRRAIQMPQSLHTHP